MKLDGAVVRVNGVTVGAELFYIHGTLEMIPISDEIHSLEPWDEPHHKIRRIEIDKAVTFFNVCGLLYMFEDGVQPHGRSMSGDLRLRVRNSSNQRD